MGWIRPRARSGSHAGGLRTFATVWRASARGTVVTDNHTPKAGGSPCPGPSPPSSPALALSGAAAAPAIADDASLKAATEQGQRGVKAPLRSSRRRSTSSSPTAPQPPQKGAGRDHRGCARRPPDTPSWSPPRSVGRALRESAQGAAGRPQSPARRLQDVRTAGSAAAARWPAENGEKNPRWRPGASSTARRLAAEGAEAC